MKGILVINKEKDMTSRDVVNKLNHIFTMKKIGHTGTLDPMATGVLVVCLGTYTKLVDLITSLDKEYIASVRFGINTDTLDITGNVLEEEKFEVSKTDVQNILNKYIGSYEQEVPKYSSVKINGRKLYEYARNNEDVILPKRMVNIYNAELLDFYVSGFKFKVSVSKGTYIRSFIRDICNELGVLGVMDSLIRTKQGLFKLDDSYTLEDVKNGDYKILNVENALNINVFDMNEDIYFKVKNGSKLTLEVSNGLYLMKNKSEEIAIYEFISNQGKIKVML